MLFLVILIYTLNGAVKVEPVTLTGSNGECQTLGSDQAKVRSVELKIPLETLKYDCVPIKP